MPETTAATTTETKVDTVVDPNIAMKSMADAAETLTKAMGVFTGEKSKGLTPEMLFGGRAPYGTSGPLKQSEGYSFLRAAGLVRGFFNADQCKVETDTHLKLKAMMDRAGFQATEPGKSFYVPFSTDAMRHEGTTDENVIDETRARIKAFGASSNQGYDPDEHHWLNKRMSRALGTIDDTAGGTLVGFPTLGELIELQRNLEVFSKAGASQGALPPNGRIQYPKQTGGCTAYWVGEAATLTSSQLTTGSLDLEAKKLGVLYKLNNELLRFTSPTTEALVRFDMSRQAALKADAAMFDGTGGTQIKGILTYPSTTSTWTQGVDKLNVLVAGTTGGSGDTFQPEDLQKMAMRLPDEYEPTAYVMRRSMFAALANRRADAVSAADGKGPFVFSMFRDMKDGLVMSANGVPVIPSSQVPNNRVKTVSTLTLILAGVFSDWMIARHGIMEFLMSNQGDTAFTTDQTWLRGIQHLDAGPRHAASFCVCDTLLEA